MTLLASLLALAPSLVPLSPCQELPAPLGEKLRELREAEATDVARCLRAVLETEPIAIDAFVERLRQPATRAEGLAEVAANDEGEAERIGEALGSELVEAELVRALLGPYLLAHVKFEIDSSISKRLRAIAGRYAKSAEAVLDVLPKDTSTTRSKKLPIDAAWREASQRTTGVIEDETLYREQDRGASGQATVDKEVEYLWLTYRPLVQEFEKDLERFARADPEMVVSQLAAVDQWLNAHAACTDILAGRRGVKVRKLDREGHGVLSLATALMLVSDGDPQGARKHIPPIPLPARFSDHASKTTRPEPNPYFESLVRYHYFRKIRERNEALYAQEAELPLIGSLDPLERDLLRVVNDYRMALDRVPLELDTRLVSAARGHSDEMERENYFSHDSPHEDHVTYALRCQLVGYTSPIVAECIYRGRAGMDAEDVFDAWFRSSPHHRILIAARLCQAGMGRGARHMTANLGGAWEFGRWESPLEVRRRIQARAAEREGD